MQKEEKKAVEANPEGQEQTTIRWDGSKMRSTYANVCNVSSTREEVSLMFGTNKNWHPAQKELTIELSDRLILNPFAAKRLAVLLTNTMREYENRFGELQMDVPEKTAD
ncbi:MAG: DUF3467 domain-containing protein [Desulfuromonadaceae bacterium]|nr:DUF3467 domain-containing protein [Desulfuromonadaceae bacterium]